ncbi:unnamed protein product [Phytophthora lilii]|uniref:Unnamed protein product n=1 Tax=Phytophthora lilii TaxID=2077276 RepID=A0A9W6TXJ4_9STRA|nr:unnamed protein product [Phytophthora lilii]
MLLLASFLGFITHIYSHETYETMLTFNDISETCLQLTFSIQITIIGRDVGKKVKLRSIVWFTYVAEALIIVSWLDVVGSLVHICGVDMGDILHGLENVLESVSLTFVLIFRFFYLSLSGGFRRVLAKRKTEFVLYVVVAIHETPFVILQEVTGVTWEFVQGIFMRLLIVSCILTNVIHKARRSGRSSVRSGKPSTVNEDDAPKPAGSSNSLLASIPALVRKPFSLHFSTRSGSSPAITKIAVSAFSTRQLATTHNVDYVMDD